MGIPDTILDEFVSINEGLYGSFCQDIDSLCLDKLFDRIINCVEVFSDFVEEQRILFANKIISIALNMDAKDRDIFLTVTASYILLSLVLF